MYEAKHRVPTEDKRTRSSHALVERSLLKSMQNDISHATELISSLRDEKDKLKRALRQLHQENHEKSNLIKSLKSKIKNIESLEEDDEVVKELNRANLKLKNEIELSWQGIVHKNSDFTNEIISLTGSFIEKIHEKTKTYQVFKTHMKSTNNFKQLIGNEKWEQALLLILRFFKDMPKEEEPKAKALETQRFSDEESEQENYNKIIQDSKNLLNTLNYQKNKLENLNQEYSSKESKMSPANSPLHRGATISNLTSESIISPQMRKDSSQLTNFHTANKLVKNVSKFKTIPKK